MQWKTLRLTEKTGGGDYGATARPVDERLKTLFPEISASSKPTVVWMMDLEEEKDITKAGAIFQNENIGLAMKRFNCFKVDAQGIPDGDVKEKYLRQIGFHFFDPKGKAIGKPITGKRALSMSGFNRALEKSWGTVFTMTIKVYQKKMKKVLDGFDKVDIKKQAIDRDRANLAKKPNPAKAKKVERDQAEMDKMRKGVEDLEKVIAGECALRPEFAAKDKSAE